MKPYLVFMTFLFIFFISFISKILASNNKKKSKDSNESLSLEEIELKEFYGDNFLIGNAENKVAGTGCTVFIFKNGAPTGQSVRGGGPASRESELLKPLANAGVLHAILLSGGSAFGLDAAGGL